MGMIKVIERKSRRPKVASFEISNLFLIRSNHSSDDKTTLKNVKDLYSKGDKQDHFIIECLSFSQKYSSLSVEQAEEIRDALDSMIKYVKGEED